MSIWFGDDTLETMNAWRPNTMIERFGRIPLLDIGTIAMVKQGRIRVAVPNVMGYDDAKFPKATYHAFWDETKGYPAPQDGRPVYSGLQPSFVWPQGH